MRLHRQLEFAFRSAAVAGIDDLGAAINDHGYNKQGDEPDESVPVGKALRLPSSNLATEPAALQSRDRDVSLEAKACELLRSLGATHLARKIRIEWNARLKTCAG